MADRDQNNDQSSKLGPSIYVAGKNLARAEAVMRAVRARGWHIAFDWIAAADFDAALRSPRSRELALAEHAGVMAADAMIYLWEPDQESARYEAGMAMARGIPLIVVGHDAFFFQLPRVTVAEDDSDALEALAD